MKHAYAEGSGQTLDDARAQVLADLPAELRIVNETIVSSGSVQTDQRRGASTEDAFAAAMRNLPDSAVVVDRKVVVEPKADAVRQIEAWTSQEASTAGSMVAKELGGILKRVETIRAPSQGLLGFGRHIGVFTAHVGYEAHIEILYRLPCRLRVHTVPLELTMDTVMAAKRAIELSKDALRMHTKALDSEIRVASILESGRARKPLSPNAIDFSAQYTQEYIDAERAAARDKKAAGELAESALAILSIPGVSRSLSSADLSIDTIASGLLKFALFPESWFGKVWANEIPAASALVPDPAGQSDALSDRAPSQLETFIAQARAESSAVIAKLSSANSKDDILSAFAYVAAVVNSGTKNAELMRTSELIASTGMQFTLEQLVTRRDDVIRNATAFLSATPSGERPTSEA